jgi:hypothetical protein
MQCRKKSSINLSLVWKKQKKTTKFRSQKPMANKFSKKSESRSWNFRKSRTSTTRLMFITSWREICTRSRESWTGTWKPTKKTTSCSTNTTKTLTSNPLQTSSRHWFTTCLTIPRTCGTTTGWCGSPHRWLAVCCSLCSPCFLLSSHMMSTCC